jgi:hypothetical protein
MRRCSQVVRRSHDPFLVERQDMTEPEAGLPAKDETPMFDPSAAGRRHAGSHSPRHQPSCLQILNGVVDYHVGTDRSGVVQSAASTET